MKIGLIDIDSKIPNLALMKLSTHFKQLGHKVELTSPLFADQFDEIFASKVFSYTEMPILPKKTMIGGSGCSLTTFLDEDIEHIMPDYNLYPNETGYSIGFTTRGCIRKCPFCIVPEKEGGIKFNADIYEFWNTRYKDIILLDNNIFALNGQFEKIAEQILREKLKADFNQGLDIRLLTDEKAKLLKEMKPISQWRFSFDDIRTENSFRKGAEIIIKNKINPGKFLIYILVGFNNTFEEDMRKVHITFTEYGFDPFVMLFRDFDKKNYKPNKPLNDFNNEVNQKKTFYAFMRKEKKTYQDFARWVNRKEIFKSVTWEDYRGRIDNEG